MKQAPQELVFGSRTVHHEKASRGLMVRPVSAHQLVATILMATAVLVVMAM